MFMTLPYCRRAQAIHVAHTHTHQISQTLKPFTFMLKWKLIIFTGLLENVFVLNRTFVLLGSHTMIYMHTLFVELSTLMNPMLCGPPRVTLFRDYYVGPHSSICTIIVLSPTWCRRAV